MQFGTVGTPSKIASASVMDIPRSLRWGDRVEEEEDLPTLLCASAPPRVPSFTPAVTRDVCIAAAKSPKPAAVQRQKTQAFSLPQQRIQSFFLPRQSSLHFLMLKPVLLFLWVMPIASLMIFSMIGIVTILNLLNPTRLC
jgi:hypothetical protein